MLSYITGNPFNITLDSRSRIFLSANDLLPEFGPDGLLLVNGTREAVPAVVHFNGYAKTKLWQEHAWFHQHYPYNDSLAFRVGLPPKRTPVSHLCAVQPLGQILRP